MKSTAKKDPIKTLLANTNTFKEKESIVFWALLSFVVLFLFFAPFQSHALFNGNIEAFETPIYGAVVWSSIFLLILSIYYWGHWRLRNFGDILNIAIWVIPFSYLISQFGAASHHLASNMTLISILYAIFFLLGSFVGKSKLSAKVTQYALVLSAYMVVFVGFLNLFGNYFNKDAVMFDQGLRLTSLFQYANAYAGFLMAILFVALYLVISSKKWYYVLAHSLMIIPILTSFWLTQSRGALVLLPIIFILILPFISLLRQIQMFLYLAVAAVISISITDKIVTIATPINTTNLEQYNTTGKVSHYLSFFNNNSLSGWSRLLIVSLLFAVVVTLIYKYVVPAIESKFAHKKANKYLTLVFPVGIVLAGVLGAVLLLGDTGFTKILPEILRTRLENINFQQHSVLERGTFYKDAVKLVEDYPVLGAGGAGWNVLYEKYQNNPYTSRQTHNFLLQYLVDVGILGIFFLLAFLGALFFYYFKYFFNQPNKDNDRHLIFYIMFITIFVHSLLDFDMSYVYLAAVVFLCLGGMAGSIPFKEIQWKNVLTITKLRWIYPALISVIGITILIISSVSYHANNLFNTAQTGLQMQKPYQEFTVSLDKALGLRPHHPDFVLMKINLMIQGFNQLHDESFYTKATELTKNLKKTEPNNRGVLEYEYQLALLENKKEDALAVVTDGLNKFTWDVSIFERAIDLNVQLGEQHWPNALALYDKFLAQEAHLLTLPKGQGQGNPFAVTSPIRASIGKIYFEQKKYPEAIEMLKPGLTETLSAPIDRVIAHTYLDTLKALEQEDTALAAKLDTADAEAAAKAEKDRLELEAAQQSK
ncbi:O-antigen ligase domain-containing protein [Paenibacillus psychroresistens]|uniref:O-antigen ligase domain-containing protein n=1 Tax=Paenibacillus psychroresistens TaxID=1778678 RepID=A0A6B8RRY4_9BACL|nr:O-antigen ligase family protein [Paenibacillus psychroresistens]QGQ98492.1 O-antigen ligase domain-containing protein [Paenibacillus psychroresistens]